jgi:flagellar motor protein MotB
MNMNMNTKEFPFYREKEEFEVGLRPFISQYFNLLLFAIIVFVAGIVTSLEKGRRPVAMTMSEKAAADDLTAKITALKELITKNYQPHPIMREFRIVDVANGVEIHFGAAGMFGAGQAGLNTDGEPALRTLAGVLLPVGKEYKLAIESYTDDAPILSTSTTYPSNWELSGARAARILRVFEKAGYPRENLTFVGLGETNPLLPNRDPSGHTIEANRLKNRRVVIRLTRI